MKTEFVGGPFDGDFYQGEITPTADGLTFTSDGESHQYAVERTNGATALRYIAQHSPREPPFEDSPND